MVKKAIISGLMGLILSNPLFSTRAFIESDKLMINRSNNHSITSQKDLKSGLKDLIELASKKPEYLTKDVHDQEAYAYLPKENRWIEIGKNYKNGLVLNDKEILENLFQKHDDIVILHTHPSSESEIYLNELLNVYENNGGFPNSTKINKLETEINAHMALPSQYDLKKFISESESFHNLNPKGKLIYGVISNQGIVYYSKKPNQELGLEDTFVADELLGSELFSYEPSKFRVNELIDYFNSNSNIRFDFRERNHKLFKSK